MATLQIVYDPKHGRAVPDARIQAEVDEMIARWQNAHEGTNYIHLVVGSELLVSAFHVKYLQLWAETGVRPQIEFFDDEQRVEVGGCGYLAIHKHSYIEGLLIDTMDARDVIIEMQDARAAD